MDLSKFNAAPKSKVRIANVSHIAHDQDVLAGAKHPRPARDSFEMWRAPFDIPFATSAAPWVEYDVSDATDTLLLHYSDRGMNAGLIVAFEGNEAALRTKIAEWEKENPGRKPKATEHAADKEQSPKTSILGDGVPMWLSDGDRLKGGGVAQGRGRSAANAGINVVYDRRARGSSLNG